MKKISLILLVFLAKTSIGQEVTKTPGGLKTTLNGIHIELQFFSPQLVRVVKYPEGTSFKKQSLSVVKQPQTAAADIQQQGSTALLKSPALQVALDLQTGKVSFLSPEGVRLFTEKDYGTQFTAVTDAGKPTYNVRQAFLLDRDEVIYGLGQQQNGRLNQRGQKVYLRNENMKVCIPFFQSVKGYGVFWDNYAPTTFTDNPQETSFDSEVADGSDYYFLYGGSGEGVIARMRELTGQAPLMPLWTFGFNQSRERYKTQFELVEVVKKYRSLQVPLDGIVQDWQYWGRDSNWNAMSFDGATFPRPRAMVDSVHGFNAHLFIVAWPGFGPLTPQYREYKGKNMLIDFDTWPPKSGAKPYDVYHPEARNIYWDYLNKGVFSLDADAWWLDSSEPDHINMKEKDFDQPTYLGSFRSVHNAFPLQHVGGVYDHQRATTAAKRVSILTRSAFAGQQRYGANTWSGDVGSNWETFRRQIPAGLNFSLTGIPYWNTDIGGFFAGGFVRGGGAKNPEFRELYTRWMQFAAFTPLMRSHGTDIPREIYQFGNRGDWAFDVQEKFINLRYRLLPYTYATAWDVTKNASTFMRPLYLDFAQDKQVLNRDNEYLFGKSFLVSPVTEKGAKTQSVYLPAGAVWHDFWTGEATEGGKSVTRATPMEIVPLYVKGGSIIPWGPKVQYAAEKKWDNLEVRIYPGADGEFTLYEDAGDSYDYEKGAYSEIRFRWNDAARTLAIEPRKGSFAGMPGRRRFNLVVVNGQNGAGADAAARIDKSVSYTGKAVVVKL